MSGDAAFAGRLRAGQWAASALLCAAAIAAAAAQSGTWWSASPPTSRIAIAGLLVLAYVALCVAPWRHRAPPAPAATDTGVVIAWASQTGFAAELARHTAATLVDAGVDAHALPIETLDIQRLRRAHTLLVVASTTGEGDPPDHALRFVRDVMSSATALPALAYGVLALGDREYARFCAFGRGIDRWLHRAGARALFDRVDVDAGDAGALRHWQHHVGLIAGRTDLPDWSPPRYTRWRLAQRVHLNAGSPGAPAFHLELAPLDGRADWTAGDIAEIGPRNPPDDVDAWLAARGIDADAVTRKDGAQVPLRALLARSRLPPAGQETGDPASIGDVLAPLPHREYSIASIAADGRVHLLVRQARHDDGRLGLGSGWLTASADIGEAIDLRIRRNPTFHPPATDAPLILIGNGTGLAGLRAHWRMRAATGARRTWLLFGERTRAADVFHRDEIETLQRDGVLTHVDFAFSRDAGGPRYVQDALRLQAGRLRAWVDDGAVILVCGSLGGMAPGVDAVLRDVLGNACVDALRDDDRYRRDVY